MLNRLLTTCLLATAMVIATSPTTTVFADELQLSSREFAQLDAFESHTLGKADEIFVEGDHRRAAAEYAAFLLEYPRSPAVPYAMLRKGRALMLDGKRFEGIKAFQQILDFFPNDVRFAAAASFYIGQSHWENADVEKAMSQWEQMVGDVDYAQSPLAADAFNRLAEHEMSRGNRSKAIGYYREVAVGFRRTSPDAAAAAIKPVVRHFVRVEPNESKLRAFYRDASGFGAKPETVAEELDQDRPYWDTLSALVESTGQFTSDENDLASRHYAYWAGQMSGRFPTWDDYQIRLINYRLRADGDRDKWTAALHQLFEANQKTGDFDRIIRWIRMLHDHRDKVDDYYSRLDFGRMSDAQIASLMLVFFDLVNDAPLARNTFEKLRLDRMTDSDKRRLLFEPLRERDEALMTIVCQSMDNQDDGKFLLLTHYHAKKNAVKAIPLAEELVSSPDHARDAWWKLAELHQWARRYDEAIQAYQMADNPPTNLFRIAACMMAANKLSAAVAQLREVENFFAPQAPAAAMTIAAYYKQADMTPQHIAALRGVLKKYPKSAQSSQAHQQLEKLGVRIGGGADAE